MGHPSVRAEVLCGDAAEVLSTLPDACCDALVSDPPAGVSFMQKDWDGHKGGRDQWIAWLAGIMAEARRCLRPGGYALVWALPRTSHWTAMALEDSGWTIRDSVHHIQGAGFPKSKSCLKPAHEVWWLAKAPGPLQPLQIDAARVGTEPAFADRPGQKAVGGLLNKVVGHTLTSGGPGRWPPNLLLSHHPDCQPAGVRRVRGNGHHPATRGTGGLGTAGHSGQQGLRERHLNDEAMPAYACVDGCPIKALDAQAGPRTSGAKALHHVRTTTKGRTTWGSGQGGGILHSPPEEYPASTGSASRFFPTFPGPDPQDAVPFRYEPKAPARERRLADGTPTGHPTQKPVALACWLASLVCAPGGTVLDPFAGVGSLGIGALRAGCHYLGIEQDAAYAAIAQRRLDEEQEQHAGPLFAGVSTATSAAR